MGKEEAQLLNVQRSAIFFGTNANQETSKTQNIRLNFFQDISDAVPLMVAVYNINTGEYLYVNKAVKKLLGYTPKDFTKGGFPFVVSLVHPDDYPRILEENNKALKEANSKKTSLDKDPIINFEYRMKHKNGSYKWLHTDGSVFSRGNDGSVEIVLNASLDITHRKEAEQKIEKLSKELDLRVKTKTRELLQMQENIQISEIRHRTMIEQSPLSIQILSPDGKTLQVNKAWEQLWGAKLEYLKDYNVLKDKQLIKLGIMPYIKKGFKGDPTHIPAVKYYPNKTIPDVPAVPYRWVSAIIYPVKDDRGKVQEIVLIHQDITEQKEAAEKVQQSEQQLQAIMDESPAVIFLKDLEGRYLLINRQYETLFKVTRDEIKGKTDYDLFPKETADQVTSHDRKVLKTGASLEVEEVVPHKDGLHTYISIKFPLYDSTGNPYAVCGIATDITERKQIEQRKDDFIALASHELKTPVTSVKMYAQILEQRFQKIGDKESTKYLSNMDKQLDKLVKLVNELLDISRAQTGKIEYKKRVFLIDDLIKETVEHIQIISTTHKLMFNSQTKQKVYADRDRIGQVLINLLNNAIKYSTKGEKVIVKLTKDKDCVTVSVQDFGFGIPKSEYKNIFERFYQTGDKNGQTFPGLGIGLYISSEIIKRHDGEIWVESEKGKGSIFFFTLSIAEDKKRKK